MNSIIENDYIICSSCNLKFERIKEFKHCSNCFVCTACEVYYCPGCDNEIIVTPVKSLKGKQEPYPPDSGNRDDL